MQTGAGLTGKSIYLDGWERSASSEYLPREKEASIFQGYSFAHITVAKARQRFYVATADDGIAKTPLSLRSIIMNTIRSRYYPAITKKESLAQRNSEDSVLNEVSQAEIKNLLGSLICRLHHQAVYTVTREGEREWKDAGAGAQKFSFARRKKFVLSGVTAGGL